MQHGKYLLLLLLGVSLLVAYTRAETAAQELVRLVNEYRVQNSLSAIPMSYSLTRVSIYQYLNLIRREDVSIIKKNNILGLAVFAFNNL